MLLLKIRNVKDVSADYEGNRICNYEVQIEVTDGQGNFMVIAKGEVESFNRKYGWRELVYEALESVPEPSQNDFEVDDLPYESDDI